MGTLFSFRGRSGRGRYAITFVLAFGALLFGSGAVVAIVDVVLHAFLPPPSYETVGRYNTIEALAVILWVVPVIWILFANTVKRFHDINWSGAAFLLSLIPVVGIVIAIVLLFVPGTRGANRFGEPSVPQAPPPAGAV